MIDYVLTSDRSDFASITCTRPDDPTDGGTTYDFQWENSRFSSRLYTLANEPNPQG